VSAGGSKSTLLLQSSDLKAQLARGAEAKLRAQCRGPSGFCIFYDDKDPITGFLSQYFLQPMFDPASGLLFQSAEQGMHWYKARLFRDDVAQSAVMASSSPAEAKAVGRRVTGFEEDRWALVRKDTVWYQRLRIWSGVWACLSMR
jgi:predicted NAD-dependent protein-ADP-ribosyltransferase YbiA (DUF1768 family)